MSPSAALALLLALAAAPARAQDVPSGTAVAIDDPQMKEVLQRIKEDPAFADMVAERIARSRLSGTSSSDDQAERLKAVKEMVAKDPEDATRLAMGLFGDDAAKTHDYEEGVLKIMGQSVSDNTQGNKGVLGRLRAAGNDSRLLSAQASKLSDDEKREMMRTLFEGKSGASNTVLNPMNQGGPGGPGGPGGGPAGPAVGSGGVSAGFSGYYDRLSGANLHGYSPQLLALQNKLNQRRAPGAPVLIETGKLDYETLSYPKYGMDYDVRGLEARLARDRISALARLAGVSPSARDWRDPDLEKKLLAKIPAARLPPAFARRAELAAKARAALQAFLDAAEAAKDPAKISKPLVVGLGRLQQDAARWITATALQEDLGRLDEMDDFLTPDLRLAIDAAPALPPTRAAYIGRGEELKAKLTDARAATQKAVDLLTNDGWEARLAEVDRLTGAERAARKDLERDLPVYVRAPYRLNSATRVQARWQDWLDDAALKWAPSTSYAQSVSARRARRARWLAVYEDVARGDLPGAASAAAALDAAPQR